MFVYRRAEVMSLNLDRDMNSGRRKGAPLNMLGFFVDHQSVSSGIP